MESGKLYDITTPLEVSGPHYNKEDYKDHGSIAAIIHMGDKILMMDHIKLGRWTIPVGKIKPGDSEEYTLEKEMEEELGIRVVSYIELINFDRPYIINGVNVNISFSIFDIIDYKGWVQNLEPSKHKELVFMNMEEIKNLKKISTVTKALINYHRELTND